MPNSFSPGVLKGIACLQVTDKLVLCHIAGERPSEIDSWN